MLQRAVCASEAVPVLSMPVGRSQHSEVDTSLFLVDAVCTISVSELQSWDVTVSSFLRFTILCWWCAV